MAVAKRLRLLAAFAVDEVPAEATQRSAVLRRKPSGRALPERGLLLTRPLAARILERRVPSLHRVGQQSSGLSLGSLGVGQTLPLGRSGQTLVHRGRGVEVGRAQSLGPAVSRSRVVDLPHTSGRTQGLVGVHHRVHVDHAPVHRLRHRRAKHRLARLSRHSRRHFGSVIHSVIHSPNRGIEQRQAVGSTGAEHIALPRVARFLQAVVVPGDHITDAARGRGVAADGVQQQAGLGRERVAERVHLSEVVGHLGTGAAQVVELLHGHTDIASQRQRVQLAASDGRLSVGHHASRASQSRCHVARAHVGGLDQTGQCGRVAVCLEQHRIAQTCQTRGRQQAVLCHQGIALVLWLLVHPPTDGRTVGRGVQTAIGIGLQARTGQALGVHLGLLQWRHDR